MSKKLGQLLEKMEYELVQGSLDTEVTDLAYDSRKITEGMLFVAIAGTVVDGHKFIPDVLKKGASVIVMERDVKVEDDQVTVVKVKNARAALSYLSAAYFDYPATCACQNYFFRHEYILLLFNMNLLFLSKPADCS